MCVYTIYIFVNSEKTPSSPKPRYVILKISCATVLDTCSNKDVLIILMGYHISYYFLLHSAHTMLAPDKCEVIQFGPVCDEKGLRTVMLHLIWEDFTGTELTHEDLITLFLTWMCNWVLFSAHWVFALWDDNFSPFFCPVLALVYRLPLLCRWSEVIRQAYSLQNPSFIHSEVKRHVVNEGKKSRRDYNLKS